jgi:GNAT superfamily N-acetyltransferase
MYAITREDPTSAEAATLIAALSATLASVTGASGESSFDSDDVRGDRARFVLARTEAGVAVGCGGLRPLDAKVAELKRMYAAPGTKGVGSAILAHLETEATALGYAELWLETRAVNAHAVAFYERHGYSRIRNFGKYASRSDAVCLAKRLLSPFSTTLPSASIRADR